MTDHPRAVCPACARRYAGLVSDDCPVCQGIGVIPLGAAALHYHDPAPVARAVTLYLEHAAQVATATLPPADRPAAVEAAVAELRVVGIVSADGGRPARTPPPRDTAARDVAEREAQDLAHRLGAPPSRSVVTRLTAPRRPLAQGRHRDKAPTLSATGDPTALATILDPLDPLGPDTGVLNLEHRTREHTAQVLAQAARKAQP